MHTPQRKHLHLYVNGFSFFDSNVLFFFWELVVLKCFRPQLRGNLMDVQQQSCSENSIKICSLCSGAKFSLQPQMWCASMMLLRAGCNDIKALHLTVKAQHGDIWK